METFEEKNLSDLRWIPTSGIWQKEDKNTLLYKGYEYDPDNQDSPNIKTNKSKKKSENSMVYFGQLLFNQPFIEGYIKMQVEFSEVDHRSQAQIVIQSDPATSDMLTFGIGGGGISANKGIGYLYGLRLWSAQQGKPENQQGTNSTSQTKSWTNFFQGGEGRSLKAKTLYDLEVKVQGSIIILYVDGVKVGEYNLPIPSLPGQQFGLFCGSHKEVRIRNLSVGLVHPKAFVVMQFNTPEYEALFKDVIEPICREQKLKAYRGDSTYLPGLVIADIKKQIAESKVVIAEITPANANVYYEVGYADALNKPLILIADKKDGLKPFDVQAYRTIFYENSIGGKNKIESDLREYLKNIMQNK